MAEPELRQVKIPRERMEEFRNYARAMGININDPAGKYEKQEQGA